ncbi:hypothetical protein K8R62_03650 [bacterium]|nr:hypothetical protein [bacterium]
MKQNKDIQNVIYNLPEIKRLQHKSGCRGLTYGLSHNQINILRGSHVIIINEKSVVVVAKAKIKKSSIYLFQYVRTKTNTMAKELRPILKPFSLTTDINKIRNIPEVHNMYQNSNGKGRTYGVDPNKELFGSHITLIDPEEILIIRQHRKHYRLKLFCFKKGKPFLGKKMAEILNHYNFKFLTYQ